MKIGPKEPHQAGSFAFYLDGKLFLGAIAADTDEGWLEHYDANVRLVRVRGCVEALDLATGVVHRAERQR